MIIKRLGIVFRDVCHFSLYQLEPIKFFFTWNWHALFDTSFEPAGWTWNAICILDIDRTSTTLVTNRFFFTLQTSSEETLKSKYQSRLKNNNCYPVNLKPLVTLTCTVSVNCTEVFWHLRIPQFTALAVSTDAPIHIPNCYGLQLI